MNAEDREMVNLVERFCNRVGVKEFEEFAEIFSQTVHRTIQQRFTVFCMAWLKELSTMDNAMMSDPRNAMSVELAKRIINDLSGTKFDCNGKIVLPVI